MKENQCFKDQLIEEEKIRDDLDQYNRRENLEFHGIPLNPNENTNHIIKTMAKKLNIDLKDNDISTSHRLPKSLSNNNCQIYKQRHKEFNISKKKKFNWSTRLWH